jgi:hypothetical protein
MTQISITTKTGTAKNGKAWYMAIFEAGKYSSEPLFISQLEYDYLETQNTLVPVTDRK